MWCYFPKDLFYLISKISLFRDFVLWTLLLSSPSSIRSLVQVQNQPPKYNSFSLSVVLYLDYPLVMHLRVSSVDWYMSETFTIFERVFLLTCGSSFLLKNKPMQYQLTSVQIVQFFYPLFAFPQHCMAANSINWIFWYPKQTFLTPVRRCA